MNLKKAKSLRRVAAATDAAEQTQYASGKQHNIIVDPACRRGRYLALKKEERRGQ